MNETPTETSQENAPPLVNSSWTKPELIRLNSGESEGKISYPGEVGDYLGAS